MAASVAGVLSTGKGIVRDSLQVYLDAGLTQSYPGTGTTWTDLSGNGYNFTVLAAAWVANSASGYPYFNFSGTYPIAKRVVGGVLTDVPPAAAATVMVFSSILPSTATFRTLTRSATADHAQIINTGTNTLGFYQNDATPTPIGFNATTTVMDVSTIPNYSTKLNMLVWKHATTSPYYQFQYNDNATVYSSTAASMGYNVGFSCIGGYHNNSADVTLVANSAQFWGNISVFLSYTKHLSAAEIAQNYQAIRGQFGV